LYIYLTIKKSSYTKKNVKLDNVNRHTRSKRQFDISDGILYRKVNLIGSIIKQNRIENNIIIAEIIVNTIAIAVEISHDDIVTIEKVWFVGAINIEIACDRQI